MTPTEFGDNLARFWARVERRDPEQCWPWTGQTNNRGYGRLDFWGNGKRDRVLAHRLVLQLIGLTIPDGAKVLHRCDNPPCVNPAHLRIGTQRDNVRDAMIRGRANLDGLALSPTRLAAGISKPCDVEACGGTAKARGMCASHYMSWWRSAAMKPGRDWHRPKSRAERERIERQK